MASPILGNLEAAVTKTVGIIDSTIVFIHGEAQRFADALALALNEGATKEQLAPVQAEIDALNERADALAAAIVTNPGPGEVIPAAARRRG